MEKNELYQQIKAIFLKCHPEKIVLFGSWARGEEDLYSDIDLIIVLQSNKRFLDRLADLYEMWSLNRSVDILAYTPEEFNEMLADDNSLVTRALKEGVVIYEKSAG